MFPHRPHVATHIFAALEMFFFRIICVSATDRCLWRKQGSCNFRIPSVTTSSYREGLPVKSLLSLFFRDGSCVVFLENAPLVLALYMDES